jgi:hypothetical protein
MASHWLEPRFYPFSHINPVIAKAVSEAIVIGRLRTMKARLLDRNSRSRLR